MKERARAQLKSGLVREPEPTIAALAGLIAQERAPVESRVFAIESLRGVDPLPPTTGLVDVARTAFGSRSAGVRAAALPLYAKLDPVRAGTIKVGAHEGAGSPKGRLAQGMGMVSEDRKGEGLATELTVEANMTISRLPLLVSPRAQEEAAQAAILGRLLDQRSRGGF